MHPYNNTPVIRMLSGSTLHGSQTDSSDKDYKGVAIPSQRDLLLQTAFKVQTETTKLDANERNTYRDVDIEVFSVQNFLRLLSGGQTNQIDMVFTPKRFWTMEPHRIWNLILMNRDKLITKKASAFTGFCRKQASMFSVKGERVAEIRLVAEFFATLAEKYGDNAKLQIAEQEMQDFVVDKQWTKIIFLESPNREPLFHFESMELKIAITNTIRKAIDMYRGKLNEYGKRALAAESADGADLKAISHAVRVGRSSLDLFRNGEIVFPLPYGEFLRDIKLGRVPVQQCMDEIEELVLAVEKAALTSSFPNEANSDLINFIALDAYTYSP